MKVLASTSRLFQSRQWAISLGSIAALAGWFLCGSSEEGIAGVDGLIYDIGSLHIDAAWLSWMTAVVLNLGVAIIWVFVNRQFKVIRSNTWAFVGLFMLMQLPFCTLGYRFNLALLTALSVSLAVVLLFSTYANRNSVYSVFNTFLLLGVLSTAVSETLFLLPFFVAGLFQMRVFNGRTMLAAIFGLITPFWLIWGFEWAPPFELRFPLSSFSAARMLESLSAAQIVYLLVDLVLAVVYLVGSIVKSMNYNAARRAFNGFIELLTLALVLLTIIDFENVMLYIPLLNMLVAFECAHYLSHSSAGTTTYSFATITLLFIFLSFWNNL